MRVAHGSPLCACRRGDVNQPAQQSLQQAESSWGPPPSQSQRTIRKVLQVGQGACAFRLWKEHMSHKPQFRWSISSTQMIYSIWSVVMKQHGPSASKLVIAISYLPRCRYAIIIVYFKGAISTNFSSKHSKMYKYYHYRRRTVGRINSFDIMMSVYCVAEMSTEVTARQDSNSHILSYL